MTVDQDDPDSSLADQHLPRCRAATDDGGPCDCDPPDDTRLGAGMSWWDIDPDPERSMNDTAAGD